MKGDAVNGARLKMTERIANANLVAQIVPELEPRQSRWVDVPEGKTYLRPAFRRRPGERRH
jgi:hypothetical protein